MYSDVIMDDEIVDYVEIVEEIKNEHWSSVQISDGKRRKHKWMNNVERRFK